MNRYKFTGIITVSCHTTVVAENEDEAKKIADSRTGGAQIYRTESETKAFIIEEGDGEVEIQQQFLDAEDVPYEADES